MTIKGESDTFFARFRGKPAGERLYHYARLTRMHKPIGIYLLLWPCLWALWIAAEGVPDWWILIVFVLGTVLMRAAGCAINDYADRDIDAHVARTADRPLATGDVTPFEAIAVFVVLSLAAFALVLTMNTYTVQLSFAGVVLAAIYPFAKRYTHLPQIVLGAAFAWAIPMAFAAVTNATGKVAWLLYILTVLWALAYDTIYAMADRDEDLGIGVKSTAILFGDLDVTIVAIVEAIVLLGLLLVAVQLSLGVWFYLAWLVAVIVAAFQIFMIADRHPAHCVYAFLNHHHIGLVLFVGFVLHYQFG